MSHVIIHNTFGLLLFSGTPASYERLQASSIQEGPDYSGRRHWTVRGVQCTRDMSLASAINGPFWGFYNDFRSRDSNERFQNGLTLIREFLGTITERVLWKKIQNHQVGT